jgi:hypothetical protein
MVFRVDAPESERPFVKPGGHVEVIDRERGDRIGIS